MPTRRPIVVGNWKMNTSQSEGIDLALRVAKGCDSDGAMSRVEVGVCPPFTSIDAISSALKGGGLSLAVGGQDVSAHESGAYTGQVSAAMLLDAGASLVIVGHSERRHGLGETDSVVNAKLLAAVKAGLKAILCIGETEGERTEGQTDRVNERQLRKGLSGFPPDRLHQLVIAYEPVWAIGTGKTATPEDAQGAHGFVRGVLSDLFGREAAGAIRIQYGGSMKPGNAAELLAMPDIDGGLIGGASLSAEDFLGIAHAAGESA
ncbi:MAG: triose-phosphate isomerase [Phycisphaerales bacterium]